LYSAVNGIGRKGSGCRAKFRRTRGYFQRSLADRGVQNPRQALLEVVRELGAVAGVVQHAVDVIEDVPLRNRWPMYFGAGSVSDGVRSILANIRLIFADVPSLTLPALTGTAVSLTGFL